MSRDPTPVPSSLPVVGNTIEDLQRQWAEASFQYSLARRIWWHLTPQERDAIRLIVLTGNPYYRSHPDGETFLVLCLSEIQRFLHDR